MRASIWTAAAATVFILTLATLASTAHAWPQKPGGATSIAEANETADTGDYLTIEGEVVEVRGNRLFTIRDESGDALVLIPEYLAREKGLPERAERIKVAGKWDQEKLDKRLEGIRATQLWRFGKGGGARGSPAASTAPVLVPTSSGDTPAAAAFARDNPGVQIEPTAPRDLVNRLGAKRVAFTAARKDLQEAETVYARALYKAGDESNMNPAIVANLRAAEARVAKVSEGVPALIEEARRAGVADDLMQLYKQNSGMTP
jgi:uncharacterized protein YdeI (BOF family)